MSIQRHSPEAEIRIETELPALPPEGKARLRKLIGYVRELPPERFCFAFISVQRECGTVGCAMGHMPALFPELEYNLHGLVQFRDAGRRNNWFGTFDVAAEMFGMSREVACSLFRPRCQDSVHPQLPVCDKRASHIEVAAMLEQYLALTETPKASR